MTDGHPWAVAVQGRELSYQILGLAARLAPEQLPGDSAAWVAALTVQPFSTCFFLSSLESSFCSSISLHARHTACMSCV